MVEDDEAIRDSVAECLAFEGYAVTPARNGVEALERLREPPRPDVIVLDLVMPRMDGAEFLAAMRAEAALRSVPVVLMTAAIPIPRTPLPHADAYLPKPFDLDELLATVGRFASGRAA